MFYNERQAAMSELIAARSQDEDGFTFIQELRLVPSFNTRYISSRVNVDGRQVSHRHILFACNEDANRAFQSLDSEDVGEGVPTFWKNRGATEVRQCGVDPFPPGMELL